MGCVEESAILITKLAGQAQGRLNRRKHEIVKRKQFGIDQE